MATATKKARRDRVKVNTTYLPEGYEVPEECEVTEQSDDFIEVLCPSPDPTREDWIDFLNYMADFGEPAKQIVSMVEKPWHWTPEYAEYLFNGGVNR